MRKYEIAQLKLASNLQSPYKILIIDGSGLEKKQMYYLI